MKVDEAIKPISTNRPKHQSVVSIPLSVGLLRPELKVPGGVLQDVWREEEGGRRRRRKRNEERRLMCAWKKKPPFP